MDIIIVCHTEFGFVSNKKVIADKKAVSGVKDGVLNLIEIAGKYGAKITFAVCPEVVGYFPKNIQHEIGLHVHPGWQEFNEDDHAFNVGDAYLRKNCKQSSNSTVLRDYSYEEQSNMIKTGKEYLIKTLGAVPKVFVAGRWSINNDTVKALVANGFTHDCSATAGARPSHHDWSKLPRICMPYNPDQSDYQKKGGSPLLIVPISQCFPRGNATPEAVPAIGFSWLKACFSEYYRQHIPLFHICLHSPSMTDDYFIAAMDKFLAFIKIHENVNFIFASEVGQYPNVKPISNITPYLFAFNKDIVKTFLKVKIAGKNY